MDFKEYFQNSWGLLIIMIGMVILLRSDVHLERRMVRRIFATYAMLFVYSIVYYVEKYLGDQAEYSSMRPVLCAVAYSLIAFIMVQIITVMFPMKKLWLYIPAVLNSLLCFISIPTGLVFTIDKYNHFGRGALGYLTYFICGLYFLYLIIKLLRSKNKEREDSILILFMAIAASFCFIMPLFLQQQSDIWFTNSIAIIVMMYYIYLLQQFTKRDPLTKLLNRQSYYIDMEKYSDDITAVVSLDMNGLKELNDEEGHNAGDLALKTLADCFVKAAQRGQRVYRIGGDEYAILCVECEEKAVKELISRIRQNVSESGYSCSVGYALNVLDKTPEELYTIADQAMYEEKKQYYAQEGKTRYKR